MLLFEIKKRLDKTEMVGRRIERNEELHSGAGGIKIPMKSSGRNRYTDKHTWSSEEKVGLRKSRYEVSARGWILKA